ncbi:hypothetical protein KR009_005527, partial [Drosophila setifemur]
MADAIQAACDSLNSVVEYLTTIRISEIRSCLEFLGVQHMEVVGCLVMFVLLQFTKFTIILLLAICLAYGIFYLWDTFFPELSQFSQRSMKAFKNVRTSANLPPFNFSSETDLGPGEYTIFPKSVITGGNRMLAPLLPKARNNNLQDLSLQTDLPSRDREEKKRKPEANYRPQSRSSPRESVGKQRHERQERQDRPYWRPFYGENERQSSRRNSQIASGSGGGGGGGGGGGESKRPTKSLRPPNATSGGLPYMTSDTVKRLHNVTSGESRRKSAKEEIRRLPVVTSGEMGITRRIPKMTSGTTESRWLSPSEVKDSRRSSHPHGGGESRRTSRGGGAETKSRRHSERPHAAQGRRHEDLPEERPRDQKDHHHREHRSRQSRPPMAAEESRSSKQRRDTNNQTHNRSGVTSHQYPGDHWERLKVENREYQLRHPTSEGA